MFYYHFLISHTLVAFMGLIGPGRKETIIKIAIICTLLNTVHWAKLYYLDVWYVHSQNISRVTSHIMTQTKYVSQIYIITELPKNEHPTQYHHFVMFGDQIRDQIVYHVHIIDHRTWQKINLSFLGPGVKGKLWKKVWKCVFTGAI